MTPRSKNKTGVETCPQLQLPNLLLQSDSAARPPANSSHSDLVEIRQTQSLVLAWGGRVRKLRRTLARARDPETSARSAWRCGPPRIERPNMSYLPTASLDNELSNFYFLACPNRDTCPSVVSRFEHILIYSQNLVTICCVAI